MPRVRRVLSAAVLTGVLAAGFLATPASATSAPAPDCSTANFSDNQPGASTFEPVRWMQCEGITHGYADGTYRTARHVSRGESLAFIYRYLDAEPAATDAFPDVPSAHAHAEPISWGEAEKITTGYADGTFRPEREVTRGEFASFLYRAVDPEQAGSAPQFADVPATSAHHDAIAWLAAEEISQGYSDGTFRPRQHITRGEAAILLHRHAVPAGTPGDCRPEQSGTVAYFQDAHEFSPVARDDGQRGSISRLATVLGQVQEQNDAPATVFGGDLAGGTLFGGIYRGMPFVEAFNELGVDAATFGQHDFDFGAEHARDLVAASTFPWISSNIKTPVGEPFLPGRISGVVEAGDLRIGVIGLTGSLQNSSANAEVTQIDYVEASRAALTELESQDVDAVIASAQIDLADARALMAEVPELQVVFREEDSAESAASVEEMANERLIVTGTGDYGAVMEVDFTADACDEVEVAWGIHPVVAQDPEWLQVEQDYEQDLAAQLDREVGTATEALGREQLGYLSADALRSHFDADLGWMNGGGVRADLDAGPISLRELHSIHPYSNTGVLVEVTGDQLVAALNQGADSNPGGSGGFPRPSGFTFAYSPDAPQGERVSEVELADGSAVEAEGTYTLAITNYVAINGGDGVTALQDAPVLVSPEEGIADNQALINHVTALETVTQQAPRTEVLGAGS